jgi:starch synthase
MNGEALDNGRRPATLFTIHNMAFQGLFDPHSLAPLGLPAEMFSPEGIEFYGRASYLKAGIRYSDRLTAVSPSYAREILLPEFGFGLEHLLRGRAGVLEGILNGIDHDVWTPWTDANLPRPYERNDLASKAVCKAVVQGELGLDVASEAPLVTFVSRLTWQKMAEFLPAIIPSLIERGAQFALLGEGQLEIEAALSALCERFPGKAAIHIGYDERLEHRLHAAADMLLAPARFEPCGLSQMYAMRYGSIPIVRRTGGLADSVVDTCEATLAAGTATGFHFDATTIDALLGAVDRAVALYRQPLRWRSVQRRAMSEDFGWSRSADRYLALYRQMTGNAVPVQAPERIPAVGCPAETWTAPYKGRATA